MFAIDFNNLNSYYDLGLKIISRPNFSVPERDIRFTPLDGRHGAYTEDLETYKDIEIPISFNFIDRENLTSSIRRIKHWLIGNILDKKLIFSDDLDYFYKVKQVKIDKEIERKARVLGRFTAIIVCEPFSYLKTGEHPITITQPTSIFNEGTFESQPIIKIYGQGNITLTVNNENIILTGIEQYITLDCEIEHAYKDLVVNTQNNKMQGDFPILKEGQNIITWIGNVTKIEIIPKWRCL